LDKLLKQRFMNSTSRKKTLKDIVAFCFAARFPRKQLSAVSQTTSNICKAAWLSLRK